MTSPCSRCAAALGSSCCEVKPEDRLATLTLADVERIEAHTGQPRARFAEHEWMDWDEARAYEARRLLFEGYFGHQPRRLTLRRKNGACVFFAPGQGCRLTVEARPVACRLYPFDRHADGTWGVLMARHGGLDAARASARAGELACLAVEESSSLGALYAAFDTTPEAVEALGGVLREQARAHGRAESIPQSGNGRRRAPSRR